MVKLHFSPQPISFVWAHFTDCPFFAANSLSVPTHLHGLLLERWQLRQSLAESEKKGLMGLMTFQRPQFLDWTDRKVTFTELKIS